MEVLVTSPWVPVEWIRAHGLDPRGAWFAQAEPPGAVKAGVCAFAQALSCLGQAHPHAGVVFTTACDQMRRAADAAAASHPGRGFLFLLPATWQTPAARRLYHAEVARLGEYLRSLGGHQPTGDELAVEIRRHEAQRAQLRGILDTSPGRHGLAALASFPGGGSVPSFPTAPAATAGRGVPLAVVGGPLLRSEWPLFDVVEDAGGRIVLNATEPGERSLLPPMTPLAPGQDPVAALADHYFDHAIDVFHRPNSRLYAWLAERLQPRGARGLLLWAHVGCDLWRVEAASLREAFDLPLLVLDAHELQAGGRRDAQRLRAFIESLE